MFNLSWHQTFVSSLGSSIMLYASYIEGWVFWSRDFNYAFGRRRVFNQYNLFLKYCIVLLMINALHRELKHSHLVALEQLRFFLTFYFDPVYLEFFLALLFVVLNTHKLIIVFAILFAIQIGFLTLSSFISIRIVWLTLLKFFFVIFIIAWITLRYLINIWKLFV